MEKKDLAEAKAALSDALIAELFGLFAPIVAEIIRRWREQHGVDPTDAEITAEFHANTGLYLGEGSAWRAAHPRG